MRIHLHNLTDHHPTQFKLPSYLSIYLSLTHSLTHSLNCMAKQLGYCSSSSSTTFSPSPFKNQRYHFTKFNTLPTRTCLSKWFYQIRSIIHPRDHFQLKTSNGYPLNAVSFQDGELSVTLPLIFIIFYCILFMLIITLCYT